MTQVLTRLKNSSTWTTYDIDNVALTHYIDNALRANYIMLHDIDYVVSPEQEILIVDQFTGRTMEGRRFSDGLHQAIEAKEGVPVQEETKTSASITYQNMFRMYKKLSGMTGTGKTEEDEFREIYNMRIIPIPTNRQFNVLTTTTFFTQPWMLNSALWYKMLNVVMKGTASPCWYGCR